MHSFLKHNVWMKAVSLSVTITFLWWQISWAEGLPYQQKQQQPAQLSLEDAQLMQENAEDFIEDMQAIEQLQQRAKDFISEEEYRIEAILNADIYLESGIVQTLENGQITQSRRPDNTVIIYQDNLVKKIVSPEGITQTYSYQKAQDGTITKVIVTDDTGQREYPFGEIGIYSDATIVRFEEDSISVEKNDGSQYIFAKKGQDESELIEYRDPAGNRYFYQNQQISSIQTKEGTLIKDFTINSAGELSGTLEYPDLSVLTIEEGLITKSKDAAGREFNYSYTKDEQGKIIETQIVASTQGASRTYIFKKESNGELTINGDGKEWTYSAFLKLLEIKEGSNVFQAIYNQADTLDGFRVTLSEGTVVEYNKEGSLRKAYLPDGNCCTYFQEGPYKGLLYSLTDSQGKGCYFGYDTDTEGNLIASRRQLSSTNNFLVDPYVSGTSFFSIGKDGSLHNPTYKIEFKFTDAEHGIHIEMSSPGQAARKDFAFDYSGGTSQITTYSYEDGDVGGVYNYRGYIPEIPKEDKITLRGLTFKKNKVYILELGVEDERARLYIYEKGSEKGQPLYVLANPHPSPYIYSTIHGGEASPYVYNNLETIRYDAKGDISSYTDRARTEFEYTPEGVLTLQRVILEDGTVKEYDSQARLIRETSSTGAVVTYEYNSQDELIKINPVFPEDALVSYYSQGEFAGYVKEVIAPDGNREYYDYQTDAQANIITYKRTLYDSYKTEESFSLEDANPYLKANFTLKEEAKEHSLSLKADSRNSDKYISLCFKVYNDKAGLYYYSYDYEQKKHFEELQDLDIVIEKAEPYALEYEWTSQGVEIYLYKKGQMRPAEPIYTLNERDWNPQFCLSKENVDLQWQPQSSDRHTHYQIKDSLYQKDLQGSPLCKAEFKFNKDSSSQKVSIKGSNSTDSSTLCLKFEYSDNQASLLVYNYDALSSEASSQKIPLPLSLDEEKAYICEMKFQEGKACFYIYEKGSEKGEPLFTQDSEEGKVSFSSSIREGEIETFLYESLDTVNITSPCCYSNPRIDNFRNRSEFIQPDTPPLPDEIPPLLKDSGIIFPQGDIDINTLKRYDFVADIPSIQEDSNLVLERYIKNIDDEVSAISLNTPDWKEQEIEKLLKGDGTIIDSIEFDSQKDIISAKITYLNGDMAVYEDYKLKERITTTGIKTSYQYNEDEILTAVSKIYSDGIEQKIYPDGTEQWYDDTPSLIREVFPDAVSKEHYYDSQGVLLKTTVYSPGGSFKVFDSQGTLLCEFIRSKEEIIDYIFEDNIQDTTSIFLTSEEGDILRYKGGFLESIQKEDGTAIKSVRLDEEGILKNGIIKYPNGIIDIVIDGNTLERIEPSGNILRYRNSYMVSQFTAQGEYVEYFFFRDLEGNIERTIVSSSQKIIEYNSDFQLVKIIDTANHKTIEFDEGILKSIILGEGFKLIYHSQLDIGGTTAVFLSEIVTPQGETLAYTQDLDLYGILPEEEFKDYGDIVREEVLSGIFAGGIEKTFLNWSNSQRGSTGLIASYEGQSEFQDKGYTYDQALATQMYLLAGDYDSARNILQFFMDKWGGSLFYAAYDVSSGDIAEYDRYIGPNAHLAIACLQYTKITEDERFLNLATGIADEIIELQTASEGGIAGGPGLGWVSTEHNLSSYALFKLLYQYTDNEKYLQAMEKIEHWLVTVAYNEEEGFLRRGSNDNSFSVDNQSWAIASLGINKLQDLGIDPYQLLTFTEEQAEVEVDYNGQNVKGFDFVNPEKVGRNFTPMISTEWTSQMIIAYLLTLQDEKAKFYLHELSKCVIEEDIKEALPYSTYQQDISPQSQGLKGITGWWLALDKPSVAGTAYYNFAMLGYNPFQFIDEQPAVNQGYQGEKLKIFQPGLPLCIEYNQDKSFQSLTTVKGAGFLYDNGLLKEFINPEGEHIYYTYSFDENNNVVLVHVLREGVERVYGINGELTQLKNSQQSLFVDNGIITNILSSDGSEVIVERVDSQANIFEGEVIASDGRRFLYENGKISKVYNPDASIVEVTAGKVTAVITPGDLRYEYSEFIDEQGNPRQKITLVEFKTSDATRVVLDEAFKPLTIYANQGFILEDIEFINGFIYNANVRFREGLHVVLNQGRVEAIYTDEGTALTDDPLLHKSGFYEFIEKFNIDNAMSNSPLESVYEPDGTLVKSVYAKGVAAFFEDEKPINVESVNGEKVEYFYEQGKIVKAKVINENGELFFVFYEMGKARRVTDEQGKDLFTYEYEYDEGNKEFVLVEDVETAEIRKFSDGDLCEVVDSSGIVTTYEYDEYKRIAKSQVLWQGKVLKAFTYSYEPGLTLIRDDITKATRIYDKEGKLVYTQNDDGLRWTVETLHSSYDGIEEDISEYRLIQAFTDEGITIHYTRDKDIESIVLKDGTVIEVDKSDESGEFDRVVVEEGLVKSVTYKERIPKSKFTSEQFKMLTDNELLRQCRSDENSVYWNFSSEEELRSHLEEMLIPNIEEIVQLWEQTYKQGWVGEFIRDENENLVGVRVDDEVNRQILFYSAEGYLVSLRSKDDPAKISYFRYQKDESGRIENVHKIDYNLLQVAGKTLPVRVYATSLGTVGEGEGEQWDAGIVVDGFHVDQFNRNWQWEEMRLSWTGRGYIIVVMDEDSGEVLDSKIFDIWGAGHFHNSGEAEANKMAGFIEGIPSGRFVIMAIGDEGSEYMTQRARQAIKQIGSSLIDTVGWRDSWAIIGRKGASPGEAIEMYRAHNQGVVEIFGYQMQEHFYKNEESIFTETITETKTICHKEVVGGKVLPRKVEVFSAGYDDGFNAYIKIDEEKVDKFVQEWVGGIWMGRGYIVVVLDGESGAIKTNDIFDVYEKGSSEVERLTNVLRNVKSGDFVIMAIGDEGYTYWKYSEWELNPDKTILTSAFYQQVESLGSTQIRNLGFRDSWAIIGRKGAGSGSILEVLSKHNSGSAKIKAYEIEEKTETYEVVEIIRPEINRQDFKIIDSLYWTVSDYPMGLPVVDSVKMAGSSLSGYHKNYNYIYPNTGFYWLWQRQTEDFPDYDGYVEALTDLAKPFVHKAVYYDSRYSSNYMSVQHSETMKERLEQSGFVVLNALSLRFWMEKHSYDSMVIFAKDICPDTIFDYNEIDTLVKDYLQRGGSIVWTHDNPFYYVGYPDGTFFTWADGGSRKVVGQLATDSPVPSIQVDPLDITFSLLRFDVNVNYRMVDWTKIRDSIGFELAEDTAIISDYDSKDTLIRVVKADGIVTDYTPEGKVESVSDIKGYTFVENLYDDEGNLLQVNNYRLREEVENLIDEYKYQISERKLYTIKELAREHQVIYTAISEQFESALTQLQQGLKDAQRALSDLEGRKARGRKAKKKKSAALDDLRRQINEIKRGITEVQQSYANAIAELNTNVNNARQEIDAEEQASLLQLEEQKLKLQEEVIRAETVPIIIDAYRSVLGRDPDEAEIEHWYEISGSIQTEELVYKIRDDLLSTQEYQDKTTAKEETIQAIEEALNELFINQDYQILETLNLTPEEIVTLTQEQITEIASWLREQDLHFGNSAVDSLLLLLQEQGVSVERKELLVNLILTDILCGIITPFQQGELLISLYALNRTASSYNVTLHPFRITYEQLLEAFQGDKSYKAILHIKEDHYVVLTRVEQDRVYYFETGIGTEGEEASLSKEDFLDAWEGIVLTPQNIPNAQPLTEEQQRQIRGAFFPFIVAFVVNFIIITFQVITFVVTTILNLIWTFITQVIPQVLAWIGKAILNIGKFLINIGKGIFNVIKGVGKTLFKGFSSFFKNPIAKLFGVSAEKGAGAATLSTKIFKNISSIAIRYGTNRGLEEVGLDDEAAGLVSAFTTGSIMGGFTSEGFKFADFVSSGVQATAIEGINQVGIREGIDPGLMNIAAITGGVFAKNLFTDPLDSISLTLDAVVPQLSQELTYWGIGKLGEELGLDPRISYLAGMTVGNSIAGLASGASSEDIWQGVQDGFVRGVTSIGLDYAFQEAGLEPWEGALAGRTIVGILDGALSKGHRSIFETVKQSWADSTFNVLTLGGEGTTAWGRSVYISKVLDFSNIIEENGLEQALETYATSIFHHDAIEEIYKLGGIADLLTKRAEYTTFRGTPVKKVTIKEDIVYYFNAYSDEFVARRIGNRLEIFEIAGIGPDGDFGMVSGQVEVTLEGGLVAVVEIKESQMESFYIRAGESLEEAERLLESYAKEGCELKYTVAEDGNITIEEGIIKNTQTGVEFEFEQGKLMRVDLPTPEGTSVSLEIEEGSFVKQLTPEQREAFAQYLLLNGIANIEAEGVSPDQMNGLKQGLEEAEVDVDNVLLVPLYERGNVPQDMFSWTLDYLGFNYITNEIIQKIDSYLIEHPGKNLEDVAVVAYSGSLQPLIKAIKKRDYNISTIVAVGAQTFISDLEDTQIKCIINIYGSEDEFIPIGLVGEKDFQGPETINIKLLDIGHSEYFTRPNTPGWDEEHPLAEKANDFIAELTKRGNDIEELERYLREILRWDSEAEIWIADVSGLP